MFWILFIGVIIGIFLYYADLVSTTLTRRIVYGEVIKNDERVQKTLDKGQFCLGGSNDLILYPTNDRNFFVSWKKPTWFRKNGYYVIFDTENIDSSQNLLQNFYECILAPDGRISASSQLHRRLKRLHSELLPFENV